MHSVKRYIAGLAVSLSMMLSFSPANADTITFSGTGDFSSYADVAAITSLFGTGGFTADVIPVVNGAYTKAWNTGYIGLLSTAYTQTFSSVNMSAIEPVFGKFQIIPLTLTSSGPGAPPYYTYSYASAIQAQADGSALTIAFNPGTVGFFIGALDGSNPVVSIYGFTANAISPVPETSSYVMLLGGLMLVLIAAWLRRSPWKVRRTNATAPWQPA